MWSDDEIELSGEPRAKRRNIYTIQEENECTEAEQRQKIVNNDCNVSSTRFSHSNRNRHVHSSATTAACTNGFNQTNDNEAANSKETDLADDLHFGDDKEQEIFDDPPSANNQHDNSFTFYWWDACEDARNGLVLLFGKTYSEQRKKFISCSIVVRNIERKIFLLPRKYKLNEALQPTSTEVTLEDVAEEIKSEMNNNQKTLFRSRRVMKHYAFDPTVPKYGEYLEVRYTGNVNLSSKRYSTISRIFGTKTTLLEILLLDQKIKGPCWITVEHPEVCTNASHTNSCVEVLCDDYTKLSVLATAAERPAPPPLVVLALNIKFAIVEGQEQIAVIAAEVDDRYCLDDVSAPPTPLQRQFCVFTKLKGQPLPPDTYSVLCQDTPTRVQKMDSERALLNYFLTQFSTIDPDVVVSHSVNDQLNRLYERLLKTNVQNCNKLSRMKRTCTKVTKFSVEKTLLAGRLVCDIKKSASELIRSKTYDLEALCENVLKVPEGYRTEIGTERVASMYKDCEQLLRLIALSMQDAAYILKIMHELSALPIAAQISNIAGNVMSGTLIGGFSERIDHLLLHAFDERGHIVPEKHTCRDVYEYDSVKRKVSFKGGLVLDPKAGFYDDVVLLMDFKSLYPSIVWECNICFTTVNQFEKTFPDRSHEPGVLPLEMKRLIERRRKANESMNDPCLSPHLRKHHELLQKALKLTANSLYGCLGYVNSRFFAWNLAQLIASKGREILISAVDTVRETLSLNVIYGDTDSLMINTRTTDYEQALLLGETIKDEINRRYKHIEIDIDGVFKHLLLLKKKKYASLSLVEKDGELKEVLDMKGLDMVRSDCSKLSAIAGTTVLKHIMCKRQTQDERVYNILKYLSTLKKKIVSNKIPLRLWQITKHLTKDPVLYLGGKALPHVQVATRHNKRDDAEKLKAGDAVSYIICIDGTDRPAHRRAYSVHELNTLAHLKIDANYYLCQQILPVVLRICEPIKGMTAPEIAHRLRICETAGVADVVRNSSGEAYSLGKVEAFMYRCTGCNTINGMRHEFMRCENVECTVRAVDCDGYIRNELVKKVRSFVQRYYRNEMVCDERKCPLSKTRVPNAKLWCTQCKTGTMYKIYTAKDLYSQLMYFKHLFEAPIEDERELMDPTLQQLFSTCKSHVDNLLRRSAYYFVDLKQLFQGTQEYIDAER